MRRSVALALFAGVIASGAGPGRSAATPLATNRAGGDDASTANVAATALAPVPGAAVGGAHPPRPAPVAAPPERMLLMGDSVALSLAPSLVDASRAHGVSLHNGAVSGCSLIEGVTSSPDGRNFPWSVGCASGIARYEQDMISQYQPDVVVWMSAWETANRTLDDGSLVFPGTRRGNLRLLGEIDKAAGRLRAGGARLVMVLLAPVPQGFEQALEHTALNRLSCLNAMLEDYARRYSDSVSVVYMSEFLCPNGAPCPAEVAGTIPRPDGVHFDDPAGARWAAEQLFPRLIAPQLPGDAPVWGYVGVGQA